MTNHHLQTARKHRPGINQKPKSSPAIDMTPMVDLGFLLIAFFVVTAELTRPASMNLAMPVDGPPSELADSNTLTFLLDKQDRIYYYQGGWKKAKKTAAIFRTDYSARGLRKVITNRQRDLDAVNRNTGHNELMLLIKASTGASYRNVVDILDEATINVVRKYALVPLSPGETDWLKRAGE